MKWYMVGNDTFVDNLPLNEYLLNGDGYLPFSSSERTYIEIINSPLIFDILRMIHSYVLPNIFFNNEQYFFVAPSHLDNHDFSSFSLPHFLMYFRWNFWYILYKLVESCNNFATEKSHLYSRTQDDNRFPFVSSFPPHTMSNQCRDVKYIKYRI